MQNAVHSREEIEYLRKQEILKLYKKHGKVSDTYLKVLMYEGKTFMTSK